MGYKNMGFSTKLIHSGEKPCLETGAHIAPIYQTNTFVYESYDKAMEAWEARKRGDVKYAYSRIENPTLVALEKKIAELENGESALAFSSGMSAIATAILGLAENSSHIICSDTVYGGTHELLSSLLPKLGIKTTFIDTSDINITKRAIKTHPNTSIVFVESPANPTMKLSDIKVISEIAHESGAKLVFDNTFMTPYMQKPLSLGADIIASSCTKFLGGHGIAIGGIVVGSDADIKKIKQWRSEIGTTLNPFNAWLILAGIKTLAVRMEMASSNAMKIAEFLESHPNVIKVYYPGLSTFQQYDLAKKQMTGFGAIMSFEVRDGIRGATSVLNNVKICSLGVSLGDVSTLICHPATMIHEDMTEEERQKVGITPGLIRLSVGLENVDDLIEDLKRGLDVI